MPPLTGAACPFLGQLLRLFSCLPSFSNWEHSASSPLRGADPTSQALLCAELYYASAVLTLKIPHGVKNVPSGLRFTLLLSLKHFLSTTCQASACYTSKAELHCLSQFLAAYLTSCTQCAVMHGSQTHKRARAVQGLCSHLPPLVQPTGQSCHNFPSRGNRCFATPLQITCTLGRGGEGWGGEEELTPVSFNDLIFFPSCLPDACVRVFLQVLPRLHDFPSPSRQEQPSCLLLPSTS